MDSKITIRIDDNQKQELKRLAQLKGINLSQIIRDAIEILIEMERKENEVF